MRNPEKLVYLMRAGHNARSTSPAQPRNASAPAPVAIPAYQLNSTAHLQRQADAIAAEVFEEDNDEVLAEFERRAKQSEFKPRKVSFIFTLLTTRWFYLSFVARMW